MHLPIHFDFASPVTAFQATQALALIFGIIFTVTQLARTARSAKATNLLAITKNHRELWAMALESPELQELIDPAFSVKAAMDLSAKQRYFVNFVLLHMASTYELTRLHVLTKNSEIDRDVGALISLPAFTIMWKDLRPYHPCRFQKYVDKCIKEAKEAKKKRPSSLNMSAELPEKQPLTVTASLDGKIVSVITPFGVEANVTTRPDGSIWVTDPPEGTVVKITPDAAAAH